MTHTEDDILITMHTKGAHKYVVLYRPRFAGQASRVPCKWAMNGDLNFDFRDAATMVRSIRSAVNPPAAMDREPDSPGGIFPKAPRWWEVALVALAGLVVGRWVW